MLISAIVLIFFIFFFYLFYHVVISIEVQKNNAYEDVYRVSFIKTSLLLTVSLFIIAEGLSFFNALSKNWIMGVLLLVALALSYHIYRHPLKYPKNRSFFSCLYKQPLFWVLCVICLITFITGILFPSTNQDAYSYHLPRVYYWLQNGNLSHYYTIIDRQLFSSPLAEILIMYIVAFTTYNDYLVNMPQWLSFVGILIVISRICFLLGMDRKSQLIGMTFFATLPMAILESTSAQNDLVVCFFLIIALERLIVWIKDASLSNTIYFALALGLAVLTKGTAYVLGLPIVIIFVWQCFKKFKQRIVVGVIAGLICLSINLPHYYRNTIYFGDPLEAYPSTKSTFGVDAFMYGPMLHLYTNIPIPLSTSEIINKKLASINKDVIPYSPLETSTNSSQFLERLLTQHEDYAINFFHTLFILIVSIVIFFRARGQFKYVIWGIVLFIIFSICIPWQPWLTRLQLPMYAYFAIIFAISIGLLNRVFEWLLVSILCLFSFFPLFMNRTRPILPILYHGVIKKEYWRLDRENLRFVNYSPEFEKSKTYYSIIEKESPKHIGIILDPYSWEYQLWQFVKSKPNLHETKISHIKLDSIPDDVDLLYCKDNLGLLDFDTTLIEADIQVLKLYQRDENNGNWVRIYPNVTKDILN